MNSLAISGTVFGVVLGGAFLGMALRRFLPDHHLSPDSKDAVKVGMGLVATLAAMVLGLLIASAKSAYDTQRNELAQLAANVILLDRLLARWGPETKEIREELRQALAATMEQIWPEDRSRAGRVEPTAATEALHDRLQDLTPKTDGQRSLQAAALKTAGDIAQARWLMSSQKGSSVPVPFLIILVFWLALLFTSFNLFAPPNVTVIMAFLFCALSVAGAIFLILELDRPFDGLIQLSSDPLRRALAQMGR